MKLDSTLTGGSLRRCSILPVVSFFSLDCLALIGLDQKRPQKNSERHIHQVAKVGAF
jgi:hypothetical protein